MRKYHPMMLFVLLAPMVAPLAASEWDATWAGDVVSNLTAPANYASAAPINSATSWVSDGRYGLTRFDSRGAVLTRVEGRAEVGSQRVLRYLPDDGAV